MSKLINEKLIPLARKIYLKKGIYTIQWTLAKGKNFFYIYIEKVWECKKHR